VSTRTLRLLHSILARCIRHAQARDKVKRNVVLLCDVPTGRPGRPSKALTLEQAIAVINAAVESSLYAYIVLSLLIGARAEELRALRWCHVDLVGKPDAPTPVPPSIAVWRSVRAGETRRPRNPGARLPCRNAAWMRSARYGIAGPAGTQTEADASASCSSRESEQLLTPTTSGVDSEESSGGRPCMVGWPTPRKTFSGGQISGHSV
jgi:integrase